MNEAAKVPGADAAASSVVAICAPRGRDAQVAAQQLAHVGIAARPLATMTDLVRALTPDIGCALVTEEALMDVEIDAIRSALEAQPPWSDIPFVVLANGAKGRRSAPATARIDVLSNVILLSRPLHAEELVRAVQSALKARVRQRQTGRYLEELAQREAALRESEARFDTIVNSVDHMIWSCLPDGTHDYFNDRWYEFTGVERGGRGSAPGDGLIHPEDEAGAIEAITAALATGDPFEREYRVRRHDGAYRWVQARAQPVVGDDGGISRWYGSWTDIHEDVLAQEAEDAQNQAERDALWNGTRDLFVIMSPEGRYLDANPAWFATMGYTREELLEMRFDTLVHPDDLANATSLFTRAKDGDQVVDDPVRARHKDGRYLDVEWSVGRQGNSIFASGRDVTERNARAAAMAETEAALRQSQKLETIGQLTGGVAHDFNNLLMAIRSSLDLITRRLPPDGVLQRYLENARQATDRGAGLTQRMLAFARKQDLAAEAVDIAALLDGLRDLLGRSLGPEVAIEMAIDPDLPPVLVDRNQMEMAILNLAVNGRDAMDGSGHLTITATEVDGPAGTPAPGRYIRVAVTDTGSGMDAQTLSQAMEPFFTTKGVGTGTGLGLSMVHGLAMQSGGAFDMESTPGMGTTALLTLPVATEAGAAEIIPGEEEAVSDQIGDPDLTTWTILAVDDDFLVSMGTVGMLEDLGHEVIEAQSGAEALEKLAAHPEIDLIVTDQAMPKMTGIELAQQVRLSRPDLPIILATGYAEMPEGGADCITAKLDKPFAETALRNVLTNLPR